MSGREVAGKRRVPEPARLVHADDRRRLPPRRVFGGDGVECGDGGGVPDGGFGQVDHDVVGVVGVVELEDEVVAGGEEELAVHSVDLRCALGIEHAGDLDDVCYLPGEEDHRDYHADAHAV